MGPMQKGEATADRGGGLRARALAFLAHPSLHRVVALTVGLGALGALGQCLGSTANALPSATAPSPSPSATATAEGRASDPPKAVAGSLATPAASMAPSPSTPTSPSPSPPTPTVVDGGAVVVDLNAATIEDLRRLPGIGPKRANAILELRAKLGGFKKLEDLLRVRGIGRAAMRRLRPLVAVGPAPPRT